MSETALQEYLNARQLQSDKNDARNIRKNVNDARKGSSQAGIRWPFELLQNAQDAGPRSGKTEIAVRLYKDGSTFVFEHDGAPFSLQELTALLSGGSSKEFESMETTGRFGTGFLVTHVLSAKTRLVGLLRSHAGFERFVLELDRSGDEAAILDNIQSCNDAIRSAQPTQLSDSVPSARFEYTVDDETALRAGMDAFRQAILYLFGTCHRLGRAEFGADGSPQEIWEARPAIESSCGGGSVFGRSITATSAGHAAEVYKVLRYSTTCSDTAPGVIVVLKELPDRVEVQLPPHGLPRIFRKFPIHGSTFLDVNFVLDGLFEVNQERNTVFVRSNVELIQTALSAIPVALPNAMSERWNCAHMLARLNPVFTSDLESESSKWWNDELSRIANELALLPLVQTRRGLGASVSRDNVDWHADFIEPRLLDDSPVDETSIERLWPLVDAVEDLYPPVETLAHDWSEIAMGWSKLSVEVNLVNVDDLTYYVKGKDPRLAALKVREDRSTWLAKFIDLVGECWAARKGVALEVLKGLMPDQHGTLHDPKDLRREADIPEDLKQIAESIGIGVQARLLDTGLLQKAQYLGLGHFSTAIEAAVPLVLSEEALLDEILKQFETELEEDKKVEDHSPLASGTLRFLRYLWSSRGHQAAVLAKRCPLLASDNTVVHWSESRPMMAPVSSWDADARPFHAAYPPQRVLSSVYNDQTGALTDLTPALLAWQIAIADPLTSHVPSELKETRLKAIVEGQTDVQGLSVSGEQFSQIALLQPEVINRCQESELEARALLGLTLGYIARRDPLWKTVRTVTAKRAGSSTEIRVRESLWLADLRSKAWVPTIGEDGKIQKMLATASSLAPLLNPAWLTGNNDAIELLSRFFGFDLLDLSLLGNIPDASVRQAVREGFAKIVELGGNDRDFYEKLTQDVALGQKRQRAAARCKKFGEAVQIAIQAALKAHQLNVELIDLGFDYAVSSDQEIDLSEFSNCFTVGTRQLEVKATTSGEVKMTPKQAATASNYPDSYSLCVVDLSAVSEERLDLPWTGTEVEPLARIVSDIGIRIKSTHDLVESARTRDISIRNEAALRYAVPKAIWRAGCTIDEWIERMF